MKRSTAMRPRDDGGGGAFFGKKTRMRAGRRGRQPFHIDIALIVTGTPQCSKSELPNTRASATASASSCRVMKIPGCRAREYAHNNGVGSVRGLKARRDAQQLYLQPSLTKPRPRSPLRRSHLRRIGDTKHHKDSTLASCESRILYLQARKAAVTLSHRHEEATANKRTGTTDPRIR